MAPNESEDTERAVKGGWLGTPEAADRLGITQRTLYRLIDEGQVPAFRLGRVFRVKEADLNAFLERSRVQPGSLRHLYPGGEPDVAAKD
jgi:excisionase family DNA binding protein